MTFIDEMLLAGRGVLALLMGRRDVAGYFDLGPRGLAGSFIAFILATALNAYLPLVMNTGGEEIVHPWQATFMVLVLIALQIGFSALMLRQIGRLDGLMPYLVADNWATFYITILSGILGLIGFGGEITLLAIGVMVIIVEINIARLIVTLKPLQIAAFLIAQLVGVTVGLFVLGTLIPAPAA